MMEGDLEGEEGTRERSEQLRSHVVHQEGTRHLKEMSIKTCRLEETPVRTRCQKETPVGIRQLKGTPEARQEDL